MVLLTRPSPAAVVTVLQAGCEQRPAPGIGLGLQGNVFSDSVIVTAPSPTAAIDPEWFDQGPLNLSAKVGIAAGGFVLLLMVLDCAIVLNCKRRRRAYLRKLEAKYAQRGWPGPNGSGEKPDAPMAQRPAPRAWDDTPVSQQPLRAWDDSPMTVSTENAFPRTSRPIRASTTAPSAFATARARKCPRALLASPRDIGVDLGGHDMSGAHGTLTPSETKGKVRQEAYEMHQVDGAGTSKHGEHAGVPLADAPVLCHSGFGRTGYSLPRQYELSKADAKLGGAV